MSFDEIPENMRETYQCPECGGDVQLDSDIHHWFCSECDWSAEDKS